MQGSDFSNRQDSDKVYEGMKLFEIAWEVCNQVGGIYTVIRSKVLSVIRKCGKENYFLIGPYFEKEASANFDEAEDYSGPVGQTVLRMRELGFDIHYGQWIVSGRPWVILFDPFSFYHRLGEIRYFLWEHHHITLPENDQLLNQVASFGFQVKEFFRIFCEMGGCDQHVVAHFHEWMAGLPIPGIRRDNLNIKVVFTTHATLLGRYLAMNDDLFYEHLEFYNWEKEANYFNVRAIVDIERAAAHGAHVFTTVSSVTARECKYLLGREPELILPNGLNITRFEVLHQVQNMHAENKGKINEFVMGHFFQSYSFDLDKTIYFFTSGRYEYHNKGYDLTLEALARLNWKMQYAGIDRTVVCFFITKRNFTSFNPEVLEAKAKIEDIRKACEEIEEQIGDKLYMKITSDSGPFKFPDLSELLDDYNKLKLRRFVQSWKSKKLPKVVTHNLVDDQKDELLNFLRTANLVNNQHDKVKIVYHPDFVAASNPLFKMDYPQFVRGCHLGIFPSYYEPWGYTPLESLASGIPSITSDLSGFGDYVINNFPDHDKAGLFIVERKNNDFNQCAGQLADIMFRFVQLNRRERISLRNNCEAASPHFDWTNLGKFYDKAYERALQF
jgi:glycogen synthase